MTKKDLCSGEVLKGVEEMHTREKEKVESRRTDLIFILAQQFYGNCTGTEIQREEADYFLRGYMGIGGPEDVKDVVRKTVTVPGTDNVVIVYDRTQEEQRPEWMTQVSCEIPELDFRIYTRCFACRMDAGGVLQSLEKEDVKMVCKYLPCK